MGHEDARLALWEDGERLYCRVWRDLDSRGRREVLIAQPRAEQPVPGTVSRIAHEYGLREYLDPSWALRPLELARERGQSILVFESTRARPLDEIIGQALPIGRFLKLAIAASRAVACLHQAGLIHKDIKAANILVDPEDGAARLAGFGLASRLPRERQMLAPPELIAGTLSHMAPEQTGRMNRSVDSRSDLYALGITFYHALTGGLPFSASEPMGWIHCHIARQPAPPTTVREDIPPQLAAIVMKLLAKAPEGRYQTAGGLEHDLRRCLDEWDTRGAIAEFSLGERDRSDRLLLPDKLYGRGREIETLLAAFDAAVASGTPQLVLVSGYSGIGKSAVVGELHKALVPPRGVFATGKFDQLKRDVPYATLAQAFQSLIRQLLAKPEAELTKWREQLRHALNPNGVLLFDLIPELKFVIGEQPAVPVISSSDAKARFQATIRRLIGVFARAEHPLALFLDDLQWLDGATLDLLEDILVQPEARHLLLVGAYRDNEVDATHPLMRKLAAIREAGAVVQDIVLGPLDGDSLTEWVADAIQCQPDSARPLAQLVREKTAGNPFFVNQFLQEILEDGLIVFETSTVRWRWDLDAIRFKGYTDNVVAFMVAKLSRLPLNTQQALKGLACLGSSAKALTLATVQGTAAEELHAALWDALRLELIVRSADSYRFAHDRIQEAAYSLVSEEQRAHAHLRIGRLLSQAESEEHDEAVFEIVGHFNRAGTLLTSAEERDHVAWLNLTAGKRAKKAGAFASALGYLSAGAAVVATDGWQRRPHLLFDLELHRAECEFLTGDMSAAERHLSTLASRAKDTVQRSAVSCLLVDVHWALQQPDRGLAECLDCLRQAGLEIPMHPTKAQAQAAYDQICSRLNGIDSDELAKLPLLTEPNTRAILDVVAKVAPTALITDVNLLSLLICAAIERGLESGHCDSSCFAYEYLGLIAGWHFGDFNALVRFGQLGYELVARKNLRGFESFVCLIFASVILPWARHIASCRGLLRETLEVASNSGDRNSAVASRGQLVSNLLWSGEPLVEVETEAEVAFEFCRRAAFRDYADWGHIQLAFIRNLRGLTRQFGSLDDERFNERRMESYFESQPHLVACEFWYWVTKLQTRFLAGNYAAALRASIRAEALLSESARRNQLFGTDAYLVESEFYGALAHAGACNSTANDERQNHVDTVAHHLQVLELWSRHCPENFEHRAALVAAELARIEGRDHAATQLYEQAIRSARENNFVHHEAIALELAAQFYTARGFDRTAKAYFRDAWSGYRQWGAGGKVRHLETQYPYLRDEDSRADPKQTMLASVEQLDLATVLKLSQAVQGERDLEKLIGEVMRLGLEHAGAERGLLILPHGDGYRIEAEAQSDSKGVSVDLRTTDIGAGELPQSVLQYVLRTRERVLLQDASTSSAFGGDEYLQRHHARSVLCIPLLKQTWLTGIIYLENNLTSGAFTPARMALLEVLASDAAISLENARLYRDLREREAKVRRLIDANLIGISIWHANGRILDANDEFLRIIGYDRVDVVSGRLFWSDLIPAESRELEHRVLEKVRAGGDQKPEERELVRKDGSRIPVLTGGTTFEGVPDEGVGFMIDLTDRKRDEAEIRALKEQLYRENLALRDEVDRTSMFEEIVGASPALTKVLSRVARVAPTDSTVFVSGETGTGKELIARAVHKRSQRAERAFVSVNCAALAPTLISSELFGHEKGAFTGATQRRLGRFELADGGTIFLDEVGELLPDTQVMLLRVLQEREFERVGGAQPVHVDVRIIAATNRDLKAAIASGGFRQDLYYRLNVFPIEVPALRERKDDLLMLVEYFVQRYAGRAGKRIRSIDRKTLDLLQAYDWPGNIRELQNVIERSVILSAGSVFAVDELWLPMQSPQPAAQARPPAPAVPGDHRSEREIIEAALAESRGRIAGPSGAAARLGIPPSTLEHRIRALKIRKSQFKFR